MGASTHVILLREKDELWEKNIRALEALKDAGVRELPIELREYFRYSDVDDAWSCREEALEIDQKQCPEGCVEEYNADMSDGFDVDVSLLPKGVRTVRVFTSY